MTLPTLLLILAVATVLAWLKRPRSSGVLYCLAVALFFAVGCGPVPAALLRNLQTGYSADATGPWGDRTAIVLLGGGTERILDTSAVEVPAFAYGRIAKAFELYLACKQHGAHCIILVSGGDPQHHGVSEASVYGSQLRKFGVEPADLVLEGRSLNTWQNARFGAAVLAKYNVDRVLVVSSGIHVRRGLLYFSNFGIQATAVRADYANAVMTPVPLAYNFTLTDFAIHEYGGIWRYHIYQRLGWNVTAGSAGSL